MTPEQAHQFRDDVLNIVSQIPYGQVTTYGIIAAWAGCYQAIPGWWDAPCAIHQVPSNCPATVLSTKRGALLPGWSRQRMLLEEEGVTFKSNGHVDMSRYLWEP